MAMGCRRGLGDAKMMHCGGIVRDREYLCYEVELLHCILLVVEMVYR